MTQVGRGEGGYSLTEMVVVMIVLMTVLTGITSAFIQGSRAELHINRRVQAQLQAIGALDRLRRDVHCSSSASISGATITLSGCASGTRYWCAVTSPSVATQYALYRTTTSPCSSAGKLYADYLTSTSVFTYTAPVAATSLAKVHVDLHVNVSPVTSVDAYELTDDIVLRNSTRT